MTPENTMTVIDSNGVVRRRCRICSREKSRRHYRLPGVGERERKKALERYYARKASTLAMTAPD